MELDVEMVTPNFCIWTCLSHTESRVNLSLLVFAKTSISIRLHSVPRLTRTPPTTLSVFVSLPFRRRVAICSRLMWLTSSNWSICSSHPACESSALTPASKTLNRCTLFGFWPLWLFRTLVFFSPFLATLHLHSPLLSDWREWLSAIIRQQGTSHKAFTVLFTKPNYVMLLYFHCIAVGHVTTLPKHKNL